MTYERLTRRVIYVSLCPTCGDRQERDAHPPRERLCACGTWVPFTEVAYTGPELGAGQ